MIEKIMIDEKIYLGTVKRISENCVMILFNDTKPNSEKITNGFALVDKNENVYGDFSGYGTVYRDIDNGYILSNDGSVYVEPPAFVPHNPTEEELAEQERQANMLKIETEIQILKSQLESTDYKVIKTYEYFLVGKETEYDVNKLHSDRQKIRDKINALETTLQEM